MREPEEVTALLPGRSGRKALVQTPRTTHSQCRGRGFESHHLHQRPSSEGPSGIPEIRSPKNVTLRDFIGVCSHTLSVSLAVLIQLDY